MGPNGSGKTTLAYALMGHPAYVVKGGEVDWKGRDILKLSPDKRARLGLFLAFQYPTAIPGLSVASVHPQRAEREAPGHRQGRRHRPDRPGQGRRLDARLPQQDAREDGAPADGRGLRHALRQRGLLGRREEAPRDAPDGGPRARDGDPRRDRLGPRHRRAADRRRGRQRDAQPEPRRAAHHPLPAAAQLHHAGRRPRPGPGPHRQDRRQGPRAPPRGRGLRADPARGRPRADVSDEALLVPKGPELEPDADREPVEAAR